MWVGWGVILQDRLEGSLLTLRSVAFILPLIWSRCSVLLCAIKGTRGDPAGSLQGSATGTLEMPTFPLRVGACAHVRGHVIGDYWVESRQAPRPSCRIAGMFSAKSNSPCCRPPLQGSIDECTRIGNGPCDAREENPAGSALGSGPAPFTQWSRALGFNDSRCPDVMLQPSGFLKDSWGILEGLWRIVEVRLGAQVGLMTKTRLWRRRFLIKLRKWGLVLYRLMDFFIGLMLINFRGSDHVSINAPFFLVTTRLDPVTFPFSECFFFFSLSPRSFLLSVRPGKEMRRRGGGRRKRRRNKMK